MHYSGKMLIFRELCPSWLHLWNNKKTHLIKMLFISQKERFSASSCILETRADKATPDVQGQLTPVIGTRAGLVCGRVFISRLYAQYGGSSELQSQSV